MGAEMGPKMGWEASRLMGKKAAPARGAACFCRAGGWPRGATWDLPFYLAIPTPSSQPVCSTTACWGGAMLRVFINVPPTARIR